MADSCFQIKKSCAGFKHNDRTQGYQAKYFLPPEFRKLNECDRSADEAKILLEQMIERAKEKYTERTKQRNQAKILNFEAVVVLNENHTLEDIHALNEKLEQEFGLRAVQSAIHRDEGHIDEESGTAIYNYHAHVIYCNLDENGNTILAKLGREGLRKIQDMTAEILKMKRGVYAEESGRKHQTPQQYRAEKNKQKKQEQQEQIKELKAELLTTKERNAILEQARKDSKGKGFLKSFFDMLSNLKKSKQQYTQDELLAEIERLKELDKQRREENERLQKQQEQQAQLAAKAAELERQNKELNLKLSHEQWRNDMLKNVNDELEAENSALRQFISRAFNYIRTTSKPLFDFIKSRFSNAFTAPLLNEPKKDEEFIDRSKETQQRSNLTPLQPENNQEQKQEEQQSDEAKDKPQEQKTRKNRRQ
jgi:hypothetical protein